MRRFRAGLIAVVVVAVLAVGGVMVFRVLDERRDPVALPPGVVVDYATCVAPEVLAAAIPARVQSPGPLSDPLPPAGTVPDNFEPASVVVCQFLEYTDDLSEAVLSQTTRTGDMTDVVAQLKRESLKSPWFGECPTASSVPTPVVWLVDATGDAVRVAFPVDGTCRLPLPEAYEAVMNLVAQDEQIYRLPLAL
ncbi:hypothetical protein R3Q06_18665 [Rhodococcus erythropolis]|uniref:hypothetical protein n=1 Tax=Rhodococcus erythropolis TaxID=1833 RepID=UPI00294A2517|nr:hypothetical protein [Rhodococcus erythropolis]MDV6275523.1 hypothetical protein [Rhodococcus erythropolis]